MSSYKLSIIIPVYGVEQFILEFIQSLFPQLNEKVECIFINDGSKDNSINILESELKNCKNKQHITIIHKKNGGISCARNSGLKIIQGNFIAFLDPDDIVKSDYISTILNVIESTNECIDIIHFNAEVRKIDGKITELIIAENSGVKIIDESYLIKHFSKNHWQTCLRAFNKELLQDFSFPVGYIFEDLLSFPFLYKTEVTLYEINKKLFTYRLSENSATGKKNKLFFKSFNFAIQLYQDNLEIDQFNVIYSQLIDDLFMLKLRSNNFSEYCDFLKTHKEHIEYNKTHKKFVRTKDKILYHYPILFYIYKTRFFMKKFTF